MPPSRYLGSTTSPSESRESLYQPIVTNTPSYLSLPNNSSGFYKPGSTFSTSRALDYSPNFYNGVKQSTKNHYSPYSGLQIAKARPQSAQKIVPSFYSY